MMQGSGWRRVRMILLSTVLVGLVAYTGCDIWAGRRVAAELAKLESRYGSFENVAIAAPKVPAPENRARLVNAAAALVNTVSMEDRVALSRFMAGPAPTTLPPALRAYVESNAEAIRLARTFVTRTRSSFGVDYRSSGDRPSLADMRVLSHVLYLATLQAMEARQPDDAAALIAAGMSMSAAGRDEPDLITQLIRIAVADPPIDALQRFLEDGEPTKAGLEQIARALAENREPLPLTIALTGEVKHIHYVFSQLEAGRSNDLAVSNLPWPLLSPMTRLVRPLLRWAHARYLEEARLLLDVQTGPRPRPSRPDEANPPPWALIDRASQTFTIGLMRTIETGDDFTRQLGAAELVVALRRSKLDRGSYPEELSALVPAYLPHVPADPSTGKPPVYTRDGEGFTLTTGPSANYAPTKRPKAIWKVAR